MSNLETCPRCGGPLDRDEVDVGVGVIYGPAGCPACFWTENDVSNNPLADMKGDADFNHQEAELQLARGSFKLAEEENERLRAEVARLRAEAGTINDALGVIDASVAPAVIRELRGRVDELLTANNRYQQEARDERTLRKAREIALECVALNYSALREQAQQAAVALTRLLPGGLQADPTVDKLVRLAFKEAVFSPDFPKGETTTPTTTATDPYQHNPGARPMPHPGAK